MKTVLCFGDSNTYGYNPMNGLRYPEDVRWAGILQTMLGSNARVIEEGCNGRTTVFEDPNEPWKAGRPYLKPCLHSNRTVDYLVFMLGNNDLKTVFHAGPEQIAEGMEALVRDTYEYCDARQGIRPVILLISPPLIGEGITESAFSHSFDASAPGRSAELSALYRRIADKYGCLFLDAAEHIKASEEDSLHLMPDAHKALAQRVYQILMEDMYAGEKTQLPNGVKPVTKSNGKMYLEHTRHSIEELREIVRILCDKKEGCPWDSRQTLESLKPCLTDETGEVLDAIEKKDYKNLCEELGDVLLQIVMQSEIAGKNGWFTFDDVVQGIAEKMIRRHPHVFTDEIFHSEEEIHERWKQIKAQEKAERKSEN